MTLEQYRKWAKHNPLPNDIPKLTPQQIKRWLHATRGADMKVFGESRNFRVFVVLIYPEHTEYPFAKEVLTNKKRSNSLRRWFPVFELNLDGKKE